MLFEFSSILPFSLIAALWGFKAVKNPWKVEGVWQTFFESPINFSIGYLVFNFAAAEVVLKHQETLFEP